jgi:hypothetical protein
MDSHLTARIPQSNGKIPLYPLCLMRNADPASERIQTRLAGFAQCRADGVLNPAEQSIREEILSGLLSAKRGATQISTAMLAGGDQRDRRVAVGDVK